MSEIHRIIGQMNAAFEGPAWHGQSVLEVLKGVTAEQAARWRIGDSHTCWQIVVHIVVWKNAVRRRLLGEAYEPTDEQDWPNVTDTSDAAWKKTLTNLKKFHNQLIAVVATLSDGRLNRKMPGQKFDPCTLLHGVVQHDIYHAGQIAMMRKLK